MDCERKMQQRRIQAARDELWAKEAANYEFVAVFGKTTITADDLSGVGEKLVEKGFLMAQATTIAPLTLRVPHKNPKREPAAIKRVEREA